MTENPYESPKGDAPPILPATLASQGQTPLAIKISAAAVSAVIGLVVVVVVIEILLRVVSPAYSG